MIKSNLTVKQVQQLLQSGKITIEHAEQLIYEINKNNEITKGDNKQ